MTISNVKKIRRKICLMPMLVLSICISPALVSAQQPLAKIQAIFVNEISKRLSEQYRSGSFRNNNSIPVTKSMLLMKDDRILTHFNARVILLYLLDAVETDKEVYVRSNDEAIIGGEKSIFQKRWVKYF